MFKSALVIYIAILSCSINKPNYGVAKSFLDSSFINWNKYTFESLNMQMQLASDSKQKTMYENKLIAIKQYWNIKSIDDINYKSVRFKLLKKIFEKSYDSKRDFYIIEANESGSKVLLRSFVVYIAPNDTIEVEFYDFFNDEWQKTGKFKKDSLKIQNELKNYITQFGKGFNHDDIIITEFSNNRVIQSEYYLYSTLSAESKIKNVLDGYRKENYIN